MTLPGESWSWQRYVREHLLHHCGHSRTLRRVIVLVAKALEGGRIGGSEWQHAMLCQMYGILESAAKDSGQSTLPTTTIYKSKFVSRQNMPFKSNSRDWEARAQKPKTAGQTETGSRLVAGLPFQGNGVHEICQRGAGSRHNSRRRRIPRARQPTPSRAATAMKHEPRLSPSYHLGGDGCSCGSFFFLNKNFIFVT